MNCFLFRSQKLTALVVLLSRIPDIKKMGIIN